MLRRYDERLAAERLWNASRSPLCRAAADSFDRYVQARRTAWRRARHATLADRRRTLSPLVCHGCSDWAEISASSPSPVAASKSAAADSSRGREEPAWLLLRSRMIDRTRQRLSAAAPRIPARHSLPAATRKSLFAGELLLQDTGLPSDEPKHEPLMSARAMPMLSPDWYSTSGCCYDFRSVRYAQDRDRDVADVAAVDTTLPSATTSSSVILDVVDEDWKQTTENSAAAASAEKLKSSDKPPPAAEKPKSRKKSAQEAKTTSGKMADGSDEDEEEEEKSICDSPSLMLIGGDTTNNVRRPGFCLFYTTYFVLCIMPYAWL